MEKLQVFESEEFGKIRLVEINGEPYAVGNDIARALGYSEPRKAIQAHCKNSRKLPLRSAQGVQETTVIPVSDICHLVMKAEKQDRNGVMKARAKLFKKWFTDTVFPFADRQCEDIQNAEIDGLHTFIFDDNKKMRVICQNSESWWVLKDICEAIGLKYGIRKTEP